MTREEEWKDPEIQDLLADVKAAIDSYLHRHKKTSRAAASKEMSGIQREKQPGAFTRTQPETATQDKFKGIMSAEEPAA